MQGSVGWLCPKCGSVISPYDQTCAKCAPKTDWTQYFNYGGITGASIASSQGTVKLNITSGTLTLGGAFSGGTIYAAPAKTDAQKLAEARADAADWRDKFERVIEAMQEVIEEHQDDDEDD